QDQPTPTPEPTATPTPGGAEPTPAPQEEQEEEQNGQEETQEEDPPTPMPTPTPDPDDENAAGLENAASPTPPPGAAGEQAAGDPFPWWIILIVLALIAAVALRYWLTEPVRKARRKPDQGAEILFAAITALLARRNINKKPQETLHEFAARADRALSGGDLPSLWPLVNQLAAQIYGNHPADQAPFEHAYVALRGAAKPWTRWGLTLRRMLGMKG
ncbi:MAG: DUF4129 domain-containing protein, partial [Clostridia bacterium]|nr:DUF4129 domain-containing protein [Clostridia bacterium]